ncbi:MAG: hypothetical protein HY905_15925 [Deltaproteobacteria bacterium]|nr:hypothetical protein [Deltaproteobacteria bacterium]
MVVAIGVMAAGTARAQPENPGAFEVVTWDAGNVYAAGASLPTKVYYPAGGGGPFPVVGVIHGASRAGAYMRTLSETLASRGLVAVTPTIPCNFLGCNHDENAAQLSALLDWAVDQGATPGSPLEGLVDGERRGLVGHSWGALASHLAASRDDRIDAVVLLDPNDDVGVGAAATGEIRAATLQLLAERSGACNNQWMEGTVTPALPEPRLQLTIPRSAHCDPEDPTDGLCAVACGSGDRATTPFFRRYAVAWLACTLAADSEVAPWLGGSAFDDDLAAGLIGGVASAGLDLLPCRSAPGADADADADGDDDGGEEPDVAADAGADGGLDVGEETDEGADVDGAPDIAPDTAADATGDTGTTGGGGDGCGCRSAGRTGRGGWVLAAIGLAVLGSRRRRFD